MTSSVRIRRFTPDDMERIRTIERASIRELTPLSLLSRYYEIVPEGFLVAEVDGVVAGFSVSNIRSTRDGGREIHLLSIAVDPAYRRMRLGTALIERTADTFRDQGVDRMALEVRVSNKGAINFYERLGFQEAYVARRYYRMRGYVEDAAIMVKNVG